MEETFSKIQNLIFKIILVMFISIGFYEIARWFSPPEHYMKIYLGCNVIVALYFLLNKFKKRPAIINDKPLILAKDASYDKVYKHPNENRFYLLNSSISKADRIQSNIDRKAEKFYFIEVLESNFYTSRGGLRCPRNFELIEWGPFVR